MVHWGPVTQAVHEFGFVLLPPFNQSHAVGNLFGRYCPTNVLPATNQFPCIGAGRHRSLPEDSVLANHRAGFRFYAVLFVHTLTIQVIILPYIDPFRNIIHGRGEGPFIGKQQSARFEW